MSQASLTHSMLYHVLFPEEERELTAAGQKLFLERVLRFLPQPDTLVAEHSLVIFDFETTGLDANSDRIIEIGALKVQGGKAVAEFSSLVKPPIPLPHQAAKITGITEEMLMDKPMVEDLWEDFLKFLEGSILVAHNAEFDMAFLRNEGRRQGYQIEWPCFCTLKMARTLLPDLESRNLDALAAHYGLTFEARHRSIGDCKVTSAVLQAFLKEESMPLRTWRDLQQFAVG